MVGFTRCEVVQCGVRPVAIVVVHSDTNLALRLVEVTKGVQIKRSSYFIERRCSMKWCS